MNMHIYKPSEVRVKKNKNGYWCTVKVDNFNGKKILYNDVVGFKTSMFNAKRIFADDLNRCNSVKPNSLRLHKDYYISNKKR